MVLQSCRNPSATSTRTTRSLITDQGQSMYSLRAWAPLRNRANRSAMGSVIDMAASSPTRLGQARDQPLARQIAQAQPAHLEAAKKRARPAAQRTAVVAADLELGRALRLDAQTGLGHDGDPPRPGRACRAPAAAPCPRHRSWRW